MEVSVNEVMLLLAEKEVELYVLKKQLVAMSAELSKLRKSLDPIPQAEPVSPE